MAEQKTPLPPHENTDASPDSNVPLHLSRDLNAVLDEIRKDLADDPLFHEGPDPEDPGYMQWLCSLVVCASFRAAAAQGVDTKQMLPAVAREFHGWVSFADDSDARRKMASYLTPEFVDRLTQRMRDAKRRALEIRDE